MSKSPDSPTVHPLPKGWTQATCRKFIERGGRTWKGVVKLASFAADPEAYAAYLFDCAFGTTEWRHGRIPKRGWKVLSAPRMNPRGLSREEIDKASKKFREFLHREPERLSVIKFDSSPKILVRLAGVKEIVYESDKGDGDHYYKHEFEGETHLLFDPKNNLLIIAGPELEITKRGIEG